MNDLTLVITIKNRPEQLAFHLDSIRACKKHPKMIIVDFDSDIPVKRLAKDPWINVIHVTRKIDPFHKSRALNIGIKAAKTKYVCMSDVDQIYQPNFFTAVYKGLHSVKNPFVYCKTYRLLEIPKHIKLQDVAKHYFELLDTTKKVDRKVYGSGCCQAFERKWAIKVHGYCEKFIGWGAQDSDMVRRAKKSKLQLVNATKNTTTIHVPHSKDFNDFYYTYTTRLRNKTYYKYLIKNKIIVVNTGINWGAI